MVDEKKQLEASEAEAAKQKALADAIAEKTKALEERLKALEDSEAPPKTGGKQEIEDLGEPINRGLEFDAKDGSIRVM
jgi:peptidoglycan hydrolase CwlO-like protein